MSLGRVFTLTVYYCIMVVVLLNVPELIRYREILTVASVVPPVLFFGALEHRSA